MPSIKKQWGARTALYFVNRQTGKTFAGSVWDTEQDLQRSEVTIGAAHPEPIRDLVHKLADVRRVLGEGIAGQAGTQSVRAFITSVQGPSRGRSSAQSN